MSSLKEPKEQINTESKNRSVGAAYLFSVAATIISIPISAIIAFPDLPGFSLVFSGGIASLIAINRKLSTPIWILMGIIVLMAINTIVHLLFHGFHQSHNWFDPIYVGVVGIYCILGLVFGFRMVLSGSR